MHNRDARILAYQIHQSNNRISELYNLMSWLLFIDPTRERPSIDAHASRRVEGVLNQHGQRATSLCAQGDIHGRCLARRDKYTDCVGAICLSESANQVIPLQVLELRPCIHPASTLHTTIELLGHAFQGATEEAANDFFGIFLTCRYPDE